MKIKRLKDREKGSVIIMAMFIIFFIAVLMITIEVMRLSDLETITNHIEDMQAYYCAEAGVEYGIWWTRGVAWPPITIYTSAGPVTLTCVKSPGGFESTGWTYSTSLYTSKADSNANLYNLIHITGTGQTDRFTRRVRAHVHRTAYGGTRRYREIRRWRDL